MPRTNVNTDRIVYTDTVNRKWSAKDGPTYRVTSPLVTTKGSTYGGRFVEKRTSTDTPGYANFSPGRPLPYNSYVYEKKEVTFGPRYNYIKNNTGQWSASEGYTYSHDQTEGVGYIPPYSDYETYPSSGLSSSEIASLDARARNQALEEVKSMKINFAQAAAERKQVVDLIVNTVGDIVKIAKHLKSGNFVGAAAAAGIPVGTRRQRRNVTRRHKSRGRKGAENFSQRWLEFQYGWRPLVQDVHGAAEALAEALNQGPPYGTARGVATRVHTTASVTPDSVLTKDLYRQGTFRREGTYTIKYGLRFTASTLYWPVALGLTNPALLAWELLPFSFVADWFADIGTVIGNLDATLGCSFQDGYKTTFQKNTVTIKGNRRGSDGNYYIASYGDVKIFYLTMTRAKLYSFPMVGAPSWKPDPATKNHVANALALLTQLFK